MTRPGGRLVVCEFSTPDLVAVPDRLHRVPDAGAAADRPRVSSNPDAYVYLAESIRAWPDQPALAGRLQDAGWAEVGWRNLTGGIVALHRARRTRRPGVASAPDPAALVRSSTLCSARTASRSAPCRPSGHTTLRRAAQREAAVPFLTAGR